MGEAVQGDGDLIIDGTYDWSKNNLTSGVSSVWSGSGKVYVGSDTNRSAVLNLTAIKHVAHRPIVCYGKIVWSSTVQPQPTDVPLAWLGLKFDADSIELKGAGIPAAAFPKARFEIESHGTYNQVLTANVVSSGYMSFSTQSGISFLGTFEENNGSETRVKTKFVRLIAKPKLKQGFLQVEGGAALALDNGIDQTGGDFVNDGKLTIANGYNLSGGTFAMMGGPPGETGFLADNVTQTGGSFTVSTGSMPFDVTGAYAFSGGAAAVFVPLPMLGSEIPVAHMGALTVAADDFSLGGAMHIDDGAEVTTDGKLRTMVGANVIGVVTIDGRADLAPTTTITGGLVNNGILHLGERDAVGVIDSATVVGSFTQSADGTFLVDNWGATTDHLTITGGAALAGQLVTQAAPDSSAFMGYAEVLKFAGHTGGLALVSDPGVQIVFDYYVPSDGTHTLGLLKTPQMPGMGGGGGDGGNGGDGGSGGGGGDNPPPGGGGGPPGGGDPPPGGGGGDPPLPPPGP